MAMLVGLVYKVTAERAGRQSMDDLMKSSLYLIRSQLREIPPRDWNKTIDKLDWNLSFQFHIEPLGKRHLSPGQDRKLREGEIVALDSEYIFYSAFRAATMSWRSGQSPTCFFCMRCACLILP